MVFFLHLVVGIFVFLTAMENDYYFFDDLFEPAYKKQKKNNFFLNKEITRIVATKKEEAEIDKKSSEYSALHDARLNDLLPHLEARRTLLNDTFFLCSAKKKFNLLIKYYEPSLQQKKVEIFHDFIQVYDFVKAYTAIIHINGPFSKDLYVEDEIQTRWCECMKQLATQKNESKIAQALSYMWEEGHNQLADIFKRTPQFKLVFLCKLIDVLDVLDKTEDDQSSNFVKEKGASYMKVIHDETTALWEKWNTFINNKNSKVEICERHKELAFRNIVINNCSLLKDGHFSDFPFFYKTVAAAAEWATDYSHLWEVYRDLMREDPTHALQNKIVFLESIYRNLQFDNNILEANWLEGLNVPFCKDAYTQWHQAVATFLQEAPKNVNPQSKAYKLRTLFVNPLYKETVNTCETLNAHILTRCWLTYKTLQLSKAYWQELNWCNSVDFVETLEKRKDELTRDAYAVNAYMDQWEALGADSIGNNTL